MSQAVQEEHIMFWSADQSAETSRSWERCPEPAGAPSRCPAGAPSRCPAGAPSRCPAGDIPAGDSPAGDIRAGATPAGDAPAGACRAQVIRALKASVSEEEESP